MSGLPRPARVFARIALFLAAGNALVLPAAASSAFQGVVRDSMGRALAGAEILVLSDRQAGSPVAGAMTDEAGRFLIGELAPGLYRVAALKQGYLAYLGRVNTVLRNSLEVVLRPAPPATDPPPPESMAWALRLPERSLLRETDPPLPDEARGGARPAAGFLSDFVQGQVEHLVALSWLPGIAAGIEGIRGARTHMRLRGAVSERVSLRFEGERDSLDGPDASSRGPAATLDRSLVRLGAAWQPNAATKVDFEAFLDGRVIGVPEDEVSAQRGRSESERAWGGAAGWSRELDPGSRLAVRVGYLDSLVEAVAGGEDGGPRGARSIGAESWYESLPGRAHHLRIGVGARMLDVPSDEVRPSLGASLFGLPDVPAGWTVRLGAEDQWAVSGPLSVILGMDLDGSPSGGRAARLLVPRLGGAVTAGRLRARGTVEVVLAAERKERSAAGGSVGFDAEVEAELIAGLSASARYSSRPVDGAREGFEGGISRAPYVSDGRAAVRSTSVEIERQTRAFTFELGLSLGTVEGRVARRPPFVAPLARLEEQSFEHRNARIGVRVPRTGTDLSAEYWEIGAGGERDGTARGGRTDRYVEVLFAQQVAQLNGRRASCRLLVSARSLLGEPEGAPGTASGRTTSLEGLNERISAGLAVAF